MIFLCGTTTSFKSSTSAFNTSLSLPLSLFISASLEIDQVERTMKQSFFHSHGLLLLFLLFICLLSSYSTLAARLLMSKQGEEKVNVPQIVHMAEMEQDEDSLTLMGMEEHCKNGDEECLKGRMIAEAHLDYIYTQHHHKP